MESGQLQDHSHYRARILAVVTDVDVDRRGPGRLCADRTGGGGRAVADATVGRVLRGYRYQRVPSAGNLRADRKDHGPTAFRSRRQHRRGGVAVVEPTAVWAEPRRPSLPRK